MSQLQHYMGELTIPSGATFGVGSNTFTLTNGTRCFVSGYDGEGSGVVELMQIAIRGAGTGQGNANVQLNRATTKVQIVLNAASNIKFDSAALANICGFTNTSLSSAAAHYAERQPRYSWRPTKGLSECPADINIWWAPRSTSKTTRSVDGTVYTVQGNLIYDGTFGYRALPANVSITTATTHCETWEEFFKDVVHTGRKVRAYFDRATRNANAYAEGYIVPADSEDGEPIDAGSIDAARGRTARPWNSLWDIHFRMVKHV